MANKNNDKIKWDAPLRKILKTMKGTKVSKNFGLNLLADEKNPEILYDEFCEQVPVQSALGYTNYLRALTGKVKENPFDVYDYKNLVCKGVPAAVVDAGLDSAFPLSKNALKQSFSIERKLLSNQFKNLPKIKGKIFHIFESPDEFLLGTENFLHAGEFRSLRTNYLSFFEKGSFLPHVSEMKSVGKSKYQRIHAFLDQLKKHGKEIEVLMARPQVVNDMALFLAQREGRPVPFKELCPNLKIFLHYDERIAPYRKNLESFFEGLSVTYLKMMLHPCGFMALQTNATIKKVMNVYDDMGSFYEFVPETDVKADGSLMRYYKRHHQGNIKKGENYLLVVSNDSGLLGFNTNMIFKIENVNPLQISFKGMSESLNSFNQRISLDLMEDMIYQANENLSAHGFNIREYMIGDDLDEKKSYWVFELSRPLEGIQDQYLQSVANQIHNEMSLNNPYYRQAIANGQMPAPEITFLSLGSISDVDMQPVISHIDLSEDAERVQRILSRAQNTRTFIPKLM